MSGGLLTSAEAAKMLRVSHSTITRYVRLGLLDAVRLPSGQYRIRLEDVEKLLQRQSDQEDD